MILIGCPIYDRDWILPDWFAAIERQTIPLSEIGFIFEAAPNDQKTVDELFRWHDQHPEVPIFDVAINRTVQHTPHRPGARTWNGPRYHTMVALRNTLLTRVRCFQPERYFSLDSDILLEDPYTLATLMDLTESHPAVSPLMFMSPEDTRHPSVMSWVNAPGQRAARKRYPLGTFFRADIIMAAKMMSPPVYERVKYSWHGQGEDLGWSANCFRAGFSLYSASYLYCPHIMSKAQLAQYREQGDPRSAISRQRAE